MMVMPTRIVFMEAGMSTNPLPNKKYNIIYADPPWSFSSKELQKYNGERFTSIEKHYETQSEDWIANLPVKNITANDCALFLWTTDAHIPEAIRVMESWGFKYVTIAFVWSKLTKTGKEAWTLGSWTIKNCEICLFGTKGKMLQYKKENNVKQLIRAERTKHSKKPQEVRDSIIRMFGDIPKIEIFARQCVDKWDCWGNEV